MADRFDSLRSRLLRRLWWPLLTVLMLSAVYEYDQAVTRARDEQDLALRRVAIALASRLDVDADDVRDDDLAWHLGRTMAAMQRADLTDRLMFMVCDSRRVVIGGDATLLPLADAGTANPQPYADREVNGEPMRVVTFPHPSPLGQVTIVVAETTHRRAQQAQRVLIDTVPPNLLLIALALLLVRTGITRAMSPLNRLSDSVAKRAPEDLSSLPLEPLPKELLPLVGSINRLMTHVRTSVESQQTFLSNAAHQLRTPLAGVQTQIELALRDATDSQRQRLLKVQQALQRMVHMTHQMLALARSSSQAASTEDFEDIDLQSLLEDAASTKLDQALAAHVDLGFEAEPASVWGSSWMLREMLGNLIDNAIRHSPMEGRVTVRCGRHPAGQPWLSVEDDGPGIPADERDKVLERFYQLPSAKPGGAGLGLAIVREVVQRHGAALTLGFGEKGQGLAVRVEFPQAG
ncbi:MAG: sensor histidine kinase [Burkholderiales bacterium]